MVVKLKSNLTSDRFTKSQTMSGFRPLEARSQGIDNATLSGKDVMKVRSNFAFFFKSNGERKLKFLKIDL